MKSRSVLLSVIGLVPYLIYIYHLPSINVYFADIFNSKEGLDVSIGLALLRGVDFIRMMVFNEGLICLAVWAVYGALKAKLYVKFSVGFISIAILFKTLTYLTHWSLIQNIAYSLGLLGSNIEWFLLVLASFYFINTSKKKAL